LGTYGDFIGSEGGPLSAALDANDPWSQTFDFGLATGLGSFAIAGNAQVGAVDNAQLEVDYDIFNGDPNQGGQQTGSSFSRVPVTVEVTANNTTPEPNAAYLLVGAIPLIALGRRRRAR
jgi:hypothetical protein